jgi:hypothetical protein
MTNDKESEADKTSMPILDEVHQIDPLLHKEINENIRKIIDSGFNSSFGAFTDVIAPAETAYPQDRRVASVIAVTSDPSEPITADRRTWISRLCMGLPILGGVLAIADSFTGGAIAKVAEEWYPSDRTIDENFVRELLSLSDDRRNLDKLRDDLLKNGQFDKARIISLVTASGESLENAGRFFSETKFVELENMIDFGSFSEFTLVYLERVLSHHYRYLGYSKTAYEKFEKHLDFRSDDARLNTYILNAKHLNRHLAFHGSPDFGRLLAEDNAALSASFSGLFNNEISSLTIRSVAQSIAVGKENAALKSVFFEKQCMSSDNESEALDSLHRLDELRRLLLIVIEPETDPILMIRKYGEVMWSYARIAVIAFLKPWDRVLDRCLKVFYGDAEDFDTGERALLEDFHSLHRQELGSPVWLQMALIRAMHAEIQSGTGASVLKENIDEGRSWAFLSHATLARAYSRLRFEFGEDPTCIPTRCALAHVEDMALQDGISVMIERRRTKGL